MFQRHYLLWLVWFAVLDSGRCFQANLPWSLVAKERIFVLDAAETPVDGFGEEIDKLLEAAKQLVAETRARMEAQNAPTPSSTPKGQESPEDLDMDNCQKIKSINDRAEVIANGEAMAEVSETAEWESGSLLKNLEGQTQKDRKVEDSAQSRDLVEAVIGLRSSLDPQDFKRIFDPRNRRIGGF